MILEYENQLIEKNLNFFKIKYVFKNIMGGLEGRVYKPSKVAQARAYSDARYYQKYIKPELDKQVDPGRLAFQALGFSAGVVKGDPFAAIDYAKKGGQIYDFLDSRTFEAKRMAGNAPGDLSGKAYKGPTRIYNN